MRIWLDPATAISAGMAGVSLLSGLGKTSSGVQQTNFGGIIAQNLINTGNQQADIITNQGERSASITEDQGERAATFYEQQIPGVRRDEWEASTDMTNQSQAAESLAIATSVAQGGGLDIGVIGAMAGKYGMMQQRIKQDAAEKEWMLNSQAWNSRYNSKLLAWNTRYNSSQQAYLTKLQAGTKAQEAQMGAQISGNAAAMSGLGDFANAGYDLYKTGKSLFANSGAATPSGPVSGIEDLIGRGMTGISGGIVGVV